MLAWISRKPTRRRSSLSAPARYRRTRRNPLLHVSEMLDLRNRELAEVTNVDDFIVSDHLGQPDNVATIRGCGPVCRLCDIFDPEGSEIYMKPVRDYVELASRSPSIRWWRQPAGAANRPSVTGWRPSARMRPNPNGVHTNPKKSEAVFSLPMDKDTLSFPKISW